MKRAHTMGKIELEKEVAIYFTPKSLAIAG
jgi:hypothetical protein